MTDSGFLRASKGVFIVNDTNEKEGRFAGIYVSSDAVFDRIEVESDTGTDVKADYIAAVGTAVPSGTLITPQSNEDDYFSAITLASGTVTLILD